MKLSLFCLLFSRKITIQPYSLLMLLLLLTLAPAQAQTISLYKSFEGNIALATAGNSELNETGGSGNCGNGNQTSDSINLPAGATVKAAYLYWYAMTSNTTSGDYYPFIQIANTAPVSFPNSFETISATRQLHTTKAAWGGNWKYSGRFADVTSQVSANPNGTYTVDVQGGASNSACAYSEENVRAWNLLIVYEDPAITDNKKIYIYDGIKGYLSEGISTGVSGFQVPTTSTTGALTVVSIQGDAGIPGEYMQTSDAAFPNFPSDFANGDHGPALDIDTLTGNFTAGSTSMDLNSGSNQDLIFTTNIILTIPTVPTTSPPTLTSLTLITTVNNDNNGSATINDFGVSTTAGSLTFNTGTTVNTTTTYTSNTLSINAGSYTLTANDHLDYTESLWSCIGNPAMELVTSNNIIDGQSIATVAISEGDAIICTLNYDDIAVPSGCSTPFTGNVNAGLSPTASLTTGDKLFLGSTTLTSKTGHLKAYSVNASGLPNSTALWDAATQMTEAARTTSLYSNNTSQVKKTFNTLDNAAFNIASTSAITTLKNILYASPLGALSPNNNLALITTTIDTLNYLNDTDYRTFYSNIISQRTPHILTSSDDGFLYAFNQSNGHLGWGWMPRSLVKELQNTTMSDQHPMQGKIDVLDLKHSGNYKTYIIGSYKQGLGQYVLNLTNDTASHLDEIVWDTDLSNTKTTAPNNGERAYFRDNNNVYSIFIATGTTTNSSSLYIYSITDNSTTYEITLPFNATSTPYVMADLSQSGGKKLYLGSSNGNIYAANLLTNGVLSTTNDISNDFASAISTLGGTSAITYMGSVISSKDNQHYLRAQSHDRLSIYRYDATSATWIKAWTTSYTGENKRWTNGTNPTIDNNIEALTTGAVITENAYIVANSIVLPVMKMPTDNNCNGLAFYYFYRLADGHFPNKTFYTTNNSAEITTNLEIGIGHAKTLHLVDLKGSDKLLGLGMSEQTTTQGTGISTRFTVKDIFTTGIRSWRELWRN